MQATHGGEVRSYRRDRSGQGLDHQQIKKYKLNYYAKHGVWPWWVKHPSEKSYWLPKWSVMEGNDPRGGNYDGTWWRFARQVWIDKGPEGAKALEEYEDQWIEDNTEDAHFASLEATDQNFERMKSDGFAFKMLLESAEDKKGPRSKSRV